MQTDWDTIKDADRVGSQKRKQMKLCTFCSAFNRVLLSIQNFLRINSLNAERT